MGQRLKKMRLEQGLTQNALAVKSGTLQQAINRIETETVKNPKHLRAISSALGCTESWLRYGVDEGDNVGPAPSMNGGLIPVISWVTAGNFEDIEELSEVEEWRPCPPGLGAGCFGLRVSGDSMESPTGKSIPNGAIIYIDPNGAVDNGVLVVARSHNRATFKQYTEDAGVKYLKPLNPRYPLYEMGDGDDIIGVVKSFSMDL